MRLLLDAHAEIGCPAEAGIPALMSHMVQVWNTVHADDLPETRLVDPGKQAQADGSERSWHAPDPKGVDHAPEKEQPLTRAKLTSEAREWVVNSALVPMIHYCHQHQTAKRIYCDKSLDSVFHLPLVDTLFPNFKSILLFRHVMDTVASGIDASPWGFQAYGYGPYVQAWPGNAVAALASYWLDHATAALRWEHEGPDRCLRLRYEDLVLDPDGKVAEVQQFLGVEKDLSVLNAAFARDSTRGPGDFRYPPRR